MGNVLPIDQTVLKKFMDKNKSLSTADALTILANKDASVFQNYFKEQDNTQVSPNPPQPAVATPPAVVPPKTEEVKPQTVQQPPVAVQTPKPEDKPVTPATAVAQPAPVEPEEPKINAHSVLIHSMKGGNKHHKPKLGKLPKIKFPTLINEAALSVPNFKIDEEPAVAAQQPVNTPVASDKPTPITKGIQPQPQAPVLPAAVEEPPKVAIELPKDNLTVKHPDVNLTIPEIPQNQETAEVQPPPVIEPQPKPEEKPTPVAADAQPANISVPQPVQKPVNQVSTATIQDKPVEGESRVATGAPADLTASLRRNTPVEKFTPISPFGPPVELEVISIEKVEPKAQAADTVPPQTTATTVAPKPPQKTADVAPVSPRPVPKPKSYESGTSYTVARSTGYNAHNDPLNGGLVDRHGKKLYTLEDFLTRGAPYVSVAMDTALFPYGQAIRIPEFERKYGRQILFRVVDTGGAFQGRGIKRLDVCTDVGKASTNPVLGGSLTINTISEDDAKKILFAQAKNPAIS